MNGGYLVNALAENSKSENDKAIEVKSPGGKSLSGLMHIADWCVDWSFFGCLRLLLLNFAAFDFDDLECLVQLFESILLEMLA